MILKVNAEELAQSLALMDMALDEVPCEVHETADFEWYTSLYDRFFSVITEHSPEIQTKVDPKDYTKLTFFEWKSQFNPIMIGDGEPMEFDLSMLESSGLHKDSKRVWTGYRRGSVFYITSGRHRSFSHCFYVTEKEFDADIMVSQSGIDEVKFKNLQTKE